MSFEIEDPSPLLNINPLELGVLPYKPNLNATLIETYEARITRLRSDQEQLSHVYLSNPIRTIGNLLIRLPRAKEKLEILTSRYKSLLELKEQQPDHFPQELAKVLDFPQLELAPIAEKPLETSRSLPRAR